MRRQFHVLTTDLSRANDVRTTYSARPDHGPGMQVQQVAASMNGQTRRDKSELYRWMWQHYDQLQKERQGRPDWIGATEKLTRLGITGRSGIPLKPQNVRKVWERVVRDRSAIAKSTRPVISVPPARSPPPPLPSPSFSAEPVAFEFRTLRRAPLKKQE